MSAEDSRQVSNKKPLVSSCYDLQLDGILLRVGVVPGASKTQVKELAGDTLRIRVAAPPIDGRANLALLQFLARIFGVKKSDVELVSGDKSRAKKVKIYGVEPDQVEQLIGKLIELS